MNVPMLSLAAGVLPEFPPEVIVAAAAAAAGMRAALEFLMIGAVQTLGQALSVVRNVGHPAGGVLVDALHLQRCGAVPEELVIVDPDLLPYAQICDGPAILMEPNYQARLEDAVDGRSAAGDDGNAFTKGLVPELFVKFLDTPERVVLEFTPEMSIPFDGDRMAQGTAAAYAQFAREH